jgi:hypothetical protein
MIFYLIAAVVTYILTKVYRTRAKYPKFYEAMTTYDAHNPPTVYSRFESIVDESTELVEAIGEMDLRRPKSVEPILNELEDVKFTLFRFVEILTPASGRPAVLRLALALASPTANKHRVRFEQKGCIRSDRHCYPPTPGHDHICVAQ